MFTRENGQPIGQKIISELKEKRNYNDSISRCVNILKQIEQILKRRVIVYFSHPKSRLGIVDGDVGFLEDLLRCKSQFKGLTLILDSPGGQAVAAEKIVNACRAYACFNNTDFHVLVPKAAKSAATIISLGADKVLLTKTAELGPIDPQIVATVTVEIGKITRKYQKAVNNIQQGQGSGQLSQQDITEEDKKFKTVPQIIPAFRIVSAVDILLKESNRFRRLNKKAYNQFLEQYSYDLYEMSKNEIALSQDILIKYQREKEAKYSQNLSDDFKIFIDPTVTHSHNRPISLAELKDSKLRSLGFIEDFIEYYKKTFPQERENDIRQLDTFLWEYYMRTLRWLEDDGNAARKLIQSTAGNFIFP